MKEGRWVLGDGLHEKDNMLDGFVVEDLIQALRQEPRINRASAYRVFQQILDQRLEDARYLLNMNMDEILRRAAEGRGE